jgi:hypothetical protein
MRYYRSVSVAFAVLLVAACALLWATKSSASEEFASIRLWDNCDPETFNEAVGPDTCIPGAHGTELFSLFIQEVTLDKLAGAWRFGAAKYTLPQGRNTKLDNRGGELHTFTKVAKFGGGFVPILNQLSGNPIPAPECLEPENSSNIFVEAGTVEDGPVAGSATLPVGSTKIMCCVHPWMRTIVTVK